MKLKLILSRYEAEIDGEKFIVNVPNNLDLMSIQHASTCLPVLRNSEIWNEIYKKIDLR